MTDDTASNGVVLPAADYWKLRTIILEHQDRVRAVEQSQASVNAAIVALGLDPAKTYHLHDATLTAMVRGQ